MDIFCCLLVFSVAKKYNTILIVLNFFFGGGGCFGVNRAWVSFQSGNTGLQFSKKWSRTTECLQLAL